MQLERALERLAHGAVVVDDEYEHATLSVPRDVRRSYETRAEGYCAAGRGSSNQKVAPSPSTDSTPIVPCIRRTSSRLM